MVEQAIAINGQKRHALLAIVLAVAVIGYLFVTQSDHSNLPDHGDWRTDLVHMTAARNFVSYGFSALHYGATRDDGPAVGLQPYYYTHMASFPAVALGFLYSQGLTTAEARLLPLLVSISAILAIYFLASRMIGDWRAGALAALALAASAPFRLLSDSFAYPSYDFAAKTWTLLFITLGGLATGRRRAAWLVAAGLSSFAEIGLLGFEMVPAIAAYSILFPLLFAAPATRSRTRSGAILASALCVGLGLVAGIGLRVAHNAWLVGGLQPVIDDFVAVFLYRSSTDAAMQWDGVYLYKPTQDYALNYIALLIDRVLSYYPMHLILLVLALLVAGLRAEVLHRYLSWRPLQWLGIIFFSEILWFLVFRQHSQEYAHTIYQLSLTVSVAVGLSATLAWRIVSGKASARILALMVAAFLFLAALTNVGLQSRSDLVEQYDLTGRKAEIEQLSALLPVNAVVLIDLPNPDPTLDYFLGHTFIRRPWLKKLEGLPQPWYLITEPKQENEVYRNAIVKNPLLKKTQELALIDMNGLPDSPDSGATKK